MKTRADYLFPEIRGEESFDAVMCEDEGEVYLKEVGTGEVYVVDPDCLKDVFAEMPTNWQVGILMPDGSIGKITRVQ